MEHIVDENDYPILDGLLNLIQERAYFKYNGGAGALLCSKCRVIIKTGKDYTDKEKQASKGKIQLPPQYCDKCKNK